MDTTGFKVIKLDQDTEATAEARQMQAEMFSTLNQDRPTLENTTENTTEGQANLMAELARLVG